MNINTPIAARTSNRNMLLKKFHGLIYIFANFQFKLNRYPIYEIVFFLKWQFSSLSKYTSLRSPPYYLPLNVLINMHVHMDRFLYKKKVICSHCP